MNQNDIDSFIREHYLFAFDYLEDMGITAIKLLDGKWAAISLHELDDEGEPLPRFTATDENLRTCILKVCFQLKTSGEKP